MKEEISLEITKSGGIQMLHSDAVDLNQFGNVEVRRASHVEYSDGKWSPLTLTWMGVVEKGWYVQSASTLTVLASGFKTRAEALAWEREYYSPGGPGWAELTREESR
jgi:hypothetical protein